MIERMTKIQIIGPKGLIDECIRVLHALAVVHIEDIPAEAGAGEKYLRSLPIEKEKLKEKEFLEKAAVELDGLLHLMPIPERFRKESPPDIRRALDEIEPLKRRIRGLVAERDALKEELTLIEKYRKLLIGFAPVVPTLGGLRNFDVIGLTIEKTREDIPGLLKAEMARITGGAYEILIRELDEGTTGVVLAYPRKYSPQVRKLLSGKSISEVKLPKEYEEVTFLEALKRMEKRRVEIPEEMARLEKDLLEISRRWYGRVLGLREAVLDAIDEIGALAYASETRFAFVITGWVPAKYFDTLKERFRSIFGDRVLVTEVEVKDVERDLIPVYIRNPAILKPFEVFLAALPAPRYGSVDPTPFIAIFFPVFFGLIVGDIGYGLVIGGLSLFFRYRLRDREMFRDMATVMFVASLMAPLFGFLFGEFFGDLGQRLGLLRPLVLHRAEALEAFLVLTIGIGLGHVVLGLVVGAVNRFARRSMKEALGKTLQLLLLALLVLIAAAAADLMPVAILTPGLVALVICVAVLFIIEGVIGPLEFIKALGNILSYMRIMAVGTASVVMALVANRLGGMTEGLILGIVVATVIHIMNIVLSVLSPTIQSMRLQYVEFLSKFYEGGGRTHRPFRKR